MVGEDSLIQEGLERLIRRKGHDNRSSKYSGVAYSSQASCWLAWDYEGKKKSLIGKYKSEEEAENTKAPYAP